uniref:Uncharacterized protein n=1 Tax=Lepeophtheirus salmonis TaxID=72036 RepID=A0A0K2V3J9_LEPSM
MFPQPMNLLRVPLPCILHKRETHSLLHIMIPSIYFYDPSKCKLSEYLEKVKIPNFLLKCYHGICW